MEEKDLSIIEHLEELRKRIIYCSVFFICISFFSYFFSSKILSFIVKPLKKYQETIVFFRPVEPFFSILKITFFVSGIISIPFFLYQVYLFIGPGLTERERKVIKMIFIFFPFLFLLGMFFSYYVIIPFGLKVLFSFGKGIMQPLISITNYLNFLFIFLLIMGLIFNLPVFISSLAYIGIINSRFLKEKRKFAIVGSFILSAIITPTTDIFTQILIAIPLIFLYEISIFLSKIFNN
ncbi:MAG: twin-arginine translocase subunit TatC [Candidatus Omnitrophica bacterium]|nr:twin-arginine translocase subunit TatC [Candidatus Omnitrophota bacterium]MCM8803083.1 twin-arginine translocase subunit TatC [Candidatus Omnitrophota bacterium]